MAAGQLVTHGYVTETKLSWSEFNMIADNPGSLGKLSQIVNFVPFAVGQLYLSADGSSWLSLSLPWEPSMKEFSSLFKLDPAPALCLTLGAETLSGRSKLGIRHRQAHNSLTVTHQKENRHIHHIHDTLLSFVTLSSHS